MSSDVRKIDANIMLIHHHMLLLPPLYLFPKHRMFLNIVSDNPMKIIILQNVILFSTFLEVKIIMCEIQ